MPSTSSLLTILSLSVAALAKTDLSGCTSSQTVAFGGASMIWYVPGTGEICAPLDCGGGRAPPKTTVPGCAAYSGTETYSPSYLAGYGSDAKPTGSASVGASSSWTSASATPSSKSEHASSKPTGSSSSPSSSKGSAKGTGSMTTKAPLVTGGTAGAAHGTGHGTGMGTGIGSDQSSLLTDSSSGNGTVSLLTTATPSTTPAASTSSAPASNDAAAPRFGKEIVGLVVGAVAGLALL